jgi:hypothetical protein
MKDPEEHEIQVFRDAKPAVRDYPRGDRDRARILLLEAAQADQSCIQPGVPARALLRVKRLRGPALAGTLTAAAATVAAVAVVLSLLSGGSAPRPVKRAQTSVMAVLEQAAVTAARQSATSVPRPGQYLYLKDIEFKSTAGAGASRQARECNTLVGQEWMAGDGSGRQVGQYISSYRGCRGFEQTWPKGGVTTSDDPLDWPKNLLGWESLPASPAAIDRAIVRRFEHGHARGTATFAYAAEFLQENAPPAIRAALYRGIELLPGVRNLGPMTDRLGRHGIGVGLVYNGTRQQLIFDPATSRALEAEIVAAGPKQPWNDYQPAGTVLGYTVYVAAGLVNSGTATLPVTKTRQRERPTIRDRARFVPERAGKEGVQRSFADSANRGHPGPDQVDALPQTTS